MTSPPPRSGRWRTTILAASSLLLAIAACWTLQYPQRRDLGEAVFLASLAIWCVAPAVIIGLSPIRLLPLTAPFTIFCIWLPSDGLPGVLLALLITKIAAAILVVRLGLVLWRLLRRRSRVGVPGL